MTREARDELIWLYAAGALSEAEMATVRTLLEEGDAEDLSSLSAARETLSRLPEALDGVEPADAVFSRIMKRIDPAASAASPAAQRRSRSWILPTLLAAAAACVAVYTGLDARRIASEQKTTQEQLGQSLAELERTRSQSAAELADLRRQMEEARVASANQLEKVLTQNRVLSAANLQLTAFQGQNLPKGGGCVIWDMSNRTSHVFVFDLVPPGEGKVFELWFIEPDKAPVPAGTFTVDAQGKGQIVSPIPENLTNVQIAAITVEPIGGSPAPTSTPILVGSKAQ